MKELKELLPPAAKISGSCSTGYGEALIKAALQLDHGEVETWHITMLPLSSSQM